MDPAALLALTAVATVATAAFTGYALLQHSMERPRPRWALTRSSGAHPMHDSDEWWVYVTATNVGDGAALAVSLTASTGSIDRLGVISRAPVLLTGESLTVGAKIALRQPAEEDAYGSAIDVAISDRNALGPVSVAITWSHPPHRWLRRVKTFRVRRLAAE